MDSGSDTDDDELAYLINTKLKKLDRKLEKTGGVLTVNKHKKKMAAAKEEDKQYIQELEGKLRKREKKFCHLK